MKLAILIGNPEYNYLDELPSCTRDVEIMNLICQKIGKFDDICLVNENQNGIEAKAKISSFIEQYQGDSAQEILFYFSGHGIRIEDDFLYAFPNYFPKKQETTSLRNTELDALIRSLNPKLTIKIIDACYSGTAYIKSDETDYSHTYNKSAKENKLSNLYFMHSSTADTKSFAKLDYSLFTKSFCKSLTHSAREIRYRDIISFITDDLNEDGRQKPTFVIQAENTEKFGYISDELISQINSMINVQTEQHPKTEQSDKATKEKNSLLEIVTQKSAEEYCSKQEAFETLNAIKNTFNYDSSNELNELFEIELTELDNSDYIPNDVKIGQWLSENGNNIFFATPEFETKTYTEKEYIKRPKPPKRPTQSINPYRQLTKSILYSASLFTGLIDDYDDYDYVLEDVEKKQRYISGFKHTAESPYKALQLNFTPFPDLNALEAYSLTLATVFSRKDLILFSSKETLLHHSWDFTSRPQCLKWDTNTLALKNVDGAKAYVGELLRNFQSFILKDIENRLSQ